MAVFNIFRRRRGLYQRPCCTPIPMPKIEYDKPYKFISAEIIEDKQVIRFQYKVDNETKFIEISFMVLQKLIKRSDV